MSAETVSGTVERVVFRNPENGWCVLKIKVKGRRRHLTVVGHSHFVAPGEGIEAEGTYTDHADFGERFMATRLTTTLPHTIAGAEKYLGSGLVRGVGPKMASRLVELFKEDVFEVIESSTERLREVPGIGPGRAESIRLAWAEQKSLREIMAFLVAHGLSVTKAPRILRVFGNDALTIIRKNPYRLARDVPGIGFKSADAIARNFKLSMTSEERFAAALLDRLGLAVSRGHCAYPVAALLEEAARELSRDLPGNMTCEPLALLPALENEIESGRLSEESLPGPDPNRSVVCVFPENLAMAEKKLASHFVRIGHGVPPWRSAVFLDAPPDPNRMRFGPSNFMKSGYESLNSSQRLALKSLLSVKLGVLTGGPGTGKTTVIRAAQRELDLRGWKVACCAPTGRAAQRLGETAGIEAQTIHRLLGWDHDEHRFRHHAGHRLSVDCLILDEASMVGLELMLALVEALPDHAALLLVGDRDQLPPIQAGRVLESVLEAKVFRHEALSENLRQVAGQKSLIALAARDVLEGREPALKSQRADQDFHFIEVSTPEVCIETVLRLVRERIPNRFELDPMGDIQVICPMNKGEVGARALNRRLQEALNPEPMDRIERFGIQLSVGDKVMVTQNDYDKEVFNGDVGRVLMIERDRASLRVEFDGWSGASITAGLPGSASTASGKVRRVDFDFNELDSLALAFAVTIHKAQGSEYPAVVIPLLEESAPLLDRRLLYTAITRGRKLVVIVGSRKALAIARGSNMRSERRWSGLAGRLTQLQRAFSKAKALGEHESAISLDSMLDSLLIPRELALDKP